MADSILSDLFDHPGFEENKLWRQQTFPAGKNIFHQDDPGEDLFVVLSGKVRITYTVVLDGGQRIEPGIADFEPGDVFGEMSVLDQSPRSASASAIEETRLAVINGEKLQTFLDEHRDLGYVILKHFYANTVRHLRVATKRFGSVFAWGLKVHNIDKHF